MGSQPQKIRISIKMDKLATAEDGMRTGASILYSERGMEQYRLDVCEECGHLGCGAVWLVRTDVSEKRVASISIGVERMS
jgi:hypothetical protein